ncbi:MAG: sigma 54-interacting transcriptional regulator [Polyangiaceae bacterium]|nr:sigma 54-interacting transcriptional regulator [Polyangiaceae bacterium]
MRYLTVRGPGQVPFVLPMTNGMVIGRQDTCDLPLADSKVSRRHAVLTLAGTTWTVTDAGSTHGTFVNGQRVHTRDLVAGDTIRVGETLLLLTEDEGLSEVLLTQTPDSPSEYSARHASARLQIFYDVANAIQSLDDFDTLLERLVRGITGVLNCEAGLVGLCEPTGGLRRIEVSHGAARREIVVSRSILDAILIRKEAVIVREPSSGTMLREKILSAMGVPLLLGGRVLGLVYVDDRSARDRFSQEDLGFLKALSHLTAATIDGAERMARAAAPESAPNNALTMIQGESEPMQRLRKEVQKFGESTSNVFVHGESGTGKELVARALHACSPRRGRPFVPLNCAAIPENMVESELFGHKRGAFTGADRDRKGMLAQAHRGTVFLDEIGDLALAAQAKLLRAVQEGEVQPLGAEEPLRVDVRIVAASHKDLLAEVRAGRFREDLYYRLAVIEISVPPLRERGDDILLLAKWFLSRAAAKLDRAIVGFSPEVTALLRSHPWPGNVRELQNEVERAAVISEGALIERGDLSRRMLGAANLPKAASAPAVDVSGLSLAERFAALEPAERALVVEALALAKGNVTRAAELLGISRIMMRRRVERFDLVARDDGK